LFKGVLIAFHVQLTPPAAATSQLATEEARLATRARRRKRCRRLTRDRASPKRS
jgi:hypothetical protein